MIVIYDGNDHPSGAVDTIRGNCKNIDVTPIHEQIPNKIAKASTNILRLPVDSWCCLITVTVVVEVVSFISVRILPFALEWFFVWSNNVVLERFFLWNKFYVWMIYFWQCVLCAIWLFEVITFWLSWLKLIFCSTEKSRWHTRANKFTCYFHLYPFRLALVQVQVSTIRNDESFN